MGRANHFQPTYKIILLSLILLGFGLRVFALDSTSLWLDELMELDIAQGPISEIWPKLDRHAGMPLDYDLLHGWIKLGRQDGWVRLPAVLFGTLSIPLIFAVGRDLFGTRAGLMAAVLLTVSSFAIRYSQEARPYALLMTLTLLVYLALWRVYRTGRYRYWWMAIFAFLSAVLSHYFMLFMLVPLGLFVAGQQLRYWKRGAVWEHTAHFALLVGMLFCLFFFIGRVPRLYGVGSRFVQDVSQPQTLTASPESKPNKGTGPEVDAVFLTDSVLTPLSSQSAAVMGFSLLLISVAGLAVFQLNGHKRAAIGFTLAWLVCPIALIYLFLLQRGTFFAVRYVLYTLPAFLLLVGYGLDQLITLIDRKLTPGFTNRRLMTAVCSLILVMPLVIGEVDELIDHYRRPAYEDWRAVSQLLRANAAPNDAVLAVLAEPTMNWYYPAATVAHGTYGRNEAIWSAIADHPRRWFVLSSYSVKRDEGLRQWLSDQGAVVIAIDERVIVYLQHEGMSQTELLHEVETFDLPAKAATYALLADQFSAVGQVETAQRFYQQAIDLAASDDQRAEYATRLAQLP